MVVHGDRKQAGGGRGPGADRGGAGELVLHGDRVPAWEEGKFLEQDMVRVTQHVDVLFKVTI